MPSMSVVFNLPCPDRWEDLPAGMRTAWLRSTSDFIVPAAPKPQFVHLPIFVGMRRLRLSRASGPDPYAGVTRPCAWPFQ